MTGTHQVLSKGQNAPLTVSDVAVTLTLDAAADLSALLVTDAGTVRGDHDFVFYNQLAGPGVRLHLAQAGQPATLAIALSGIPAEISQVRTVITLDDAAGRFGNHAAPVAWLWDGAGNVLFEYRIDGLDTESIVIALDLYRRQGHWKVRAVGQGYAGGFAALVTDHGVSVDDEPARIPTSATPVAQSTPGMDRLPIDMRKRLDLRKQKVAVSLEKRGAGQLKARVILVLDASGSMSGLYSKGVVAGVVERMAAVAAQLDDDGTMQAFIFASNSARLPDFEIGNLPEWIGLHVRVGQMKIGRGSKRSKNLANGQLDMRNLGIGNEEQKVIADVRALVAKDPQPVPTLVLFFSDGGVYRNKEIEDQLRSAVTEPIFWQFVGLGRANFGILEKFDTLPGRLVDNVGFFAVDNIDKLPDEELYDRLLSEFPSWVAEAKRHRIL
ncbi:VWA domain-containing protein [Gordonia sp. ABSL49_1]|uniref:vWA domain-containing protein n=1 Tax=Gordonia sp. ABSL49_1 TaxID=2920941 RepID=UPI001F103AED|nr:VWA domain-containing protein [Gordonia sp. ABSL49_1]MCH5643281.1 VWA domain-containing protein [Gordonia sp. ABSL49_1]